MRLIDVDACSLEPPFHITLIDRAEIERQVEKTLDYAILSHRWQKQEVTFKDLNERGVCSQSCQNKYGFQKLLGAISLAKTCNHQYLWLDTCCIDKDSSSELSEAINSMYQWYSDAVVCFVYLCDVHDTNDKQSFDLSVWFTRGWTLQELLAPARVDFYSSTWKLIGTRATLNEQLSKITRIPEAILQGTADIDDTSVAARMSWASFRHTERLEDTAYCLMGLFGVNMPLLYGEGGKAFIRLQEEIIKNVDDYTIFAWRRETGNAGEHGLLADSPSDFRGSEGFIQRIDGSNREPFGVTNQGLRIHLGRLSVQEHTAAMFPCVIGGQSRRYHGIYVMPVSGHPSQYVRTRIDELVATRSSGRPLQEMYFPQYRASSQRSTSRARHIYLYFSSELREHFIPLATILNQHITGPRTAAGEGRLKFWKHLATDQSIGPFSMPLWDTGLEAVLVLGGLEKNKLGEACRLTLLLGTLPDGQIGYDIALQRKYAYAGDRDARPLLLRERIIWESLVAISRSPAVHSFDRWSEAVFTEGYKPRPLGQWVSLEDIASHREEVVDVELRLSEHVRGKLAGESTNFVVETRVKRRPRFDVQVGIPMVRRLLQGRLQG